MFTLLKLGGRSNETQLQVVENLIIKFSDLRVDPLSTEMIQ